MLFFFNHRQGGGRWVNLASFSQEQRWSGGDGRKIIYNWPVPRLPRRLSETYGPALPSRFSPWICPQQTRMPSKGQSKDTKAVGTTRLKIALCWCRDSFSLKGCNCHPQRWHPWARWSQDHSKFSFSPRCLTLAYRTWLTWRRCRLTTESTCSTLSASTQCSPASSQSHAWPISTSPGKT